MKQSRSNRPNYDFWSNFYFWPNFEFCPGYDYFKNDPRLDGNHVKLENLGTLRPGFDKVEKIGLVDFKICSEKTFPLTGI